MKFSKLSDRLQSSLAVVILLAGSVCTATIIGSGPSRASPVSLGIPPIPAKEPVQKNINVVSDGQFAPVITKAITTEESFTGDRTVSGITVGFADPGFLYGAKLDAHTAGITSYVLPNGFKIILAPYPSANTTRIELLVRTGSKSEGYGETGMAHLLEHMLFKGAGGIESVKSHLTNMGAKWNGTTNTDRTNYFETVRADPQKIDDLVRLEADRFIRPTFSKEDLVREMTVVRNEMEIGDNNHNGLVNRALMRESFAWHGYGRSTIGAKSDVEDAPFASLQAFHHKYYRPDNAALIVSGKFDLEYVLSLAAQEFSVAQNPDAPTPTQWTREDARAVKNKSELFLPFGVSIASSAWKMPSSKVAGILAMDLSMPALCDQVWGSLKKDMVEDAKLAIGVSCGIQSMPDYSLLVATAHADKSVDANVLSGELTRRIEEFAKQGVKTEDFERSRIEQGNDFDRSKVSYEAMAANISASEVQGDWRLFLWEADAYKHASRDAANANLLKWITSTNRSDVVLHHSEDVKVPVYPNEPDAKSLVAGKEWPVLAKEYDPAPKDLADLADKVQPFKLQSIDGKVAQAQMISRRTEGDMAWIVFANDYGNAKFFAEMGDKKEACDMASGLVDEGGAGLSKAQMNLAMENLQAQFSLNMSGISVHVPRDNAAEAFGILLKVWANPKLPEERFEEARKQMISAIEGLMLSPAAVAAEATSQRFDNYPMGNIYKPSTMAQSLANIKAMQYADVLACAKTFRGVSSARLSMVGEFTPKDAQIIWNKIDAQPVSSVPYKRIDDIAIPSKVDTKSIVVTMKNSPNASITGLELIPVTTNHADFPALRLAGKIFGGDSNSRLWARLREKEGISYSTGAAISGSDFYPRSAFSITATAKSESAEKAMAAVQDEYARFIRDGVTPAEVERIRQSFAEDRKNMVAQEKSYAATLAVAMYSGHDYEWLMSYDDNMARLTADDVNRAIKTYLAPAQMVWAIGKGSKTTTE